MGIHIYFLSTLTPIFSLSGFQAFPLKSTLLSLPMFKMVVAAVLAALALWWRAAGATKACRPEMALVAIWRRRAAAAIFIIILFGVILRVFVEESKSSSSVIIQASIYRTIVLSRQGSLWGC